MLGISQRSPVLAEEWHGTHPTEAEEEETGFL